MNSLKIYLTFDYELFFRRSGTPEACLLRPVERLLDLMNSSGMKATFFVDVLYLERIRECGTMAADVLRIEKQLRAAVGAGHRLGLHLHPHWLDAILRDHDWLFPSLVHYRLASLPRDEVTSLFVRGSALLNEICNSVHSGPRVDSFRAGGWCIEPFDHLSSGFRQAGIAVDSSVGFGVLSHSGPYCFDFRQAPRREIYRFQTSPLITDDRGEFIELPITTIRRSLWEKILSVASRWLRAAYHAPYGDGIGIPQSGHGLISLWFKLTRPYAFFSLDDQVPARISRVLQRARARRVVIVSHPKLLSQSALDCLRILSKLPHAAFEPVSAESLQTELERCPGS